MRKTTETVIVHVHETVSKDQLMKALRVHCVPELPDDAQIFVDVPGGGDWSNMRLDIGDDVELQIYWKTETVTES